MDDKNKMDSKFLRLDENSNFRDFFERVVYIELNSLKKRLLNTYDEGILALGYIDEQNGLSLNLLSTAKMSGERVEILNINESTNTIIRIESVFGLNYLKEKDLNADISCFDEKIYNILTSYDTDDHEKRMMRYLECLDPFRYLIYPDDVKVMLYNPETEYGEVVWVRCQGKIRYMFFGRLLNEPWRDFKIHKNDTIEFRLVNFETNGLLIHEYSASDR